MNLLWQIAILTACIVSTAIVTHRISFRAGRDQAERDEHARQLNDHLDGFRQYARRQQ